MSRVASQESILAPPCIIPDKWEQFSGNQPPVEEEPSTELVAGAYLPTPSSKVIFVNLESREKIHTSWGATSAGKGLDGLITTRARGIGPGQEWFWSDEWQAAERAAEADLAAGRFETFEDDEDFLVSLV